MLELSQIFDAGYYSANNPDLAAAGLVNPDQLFNHFTQFGINEGRGFSPYVNLDFYGAVNPDLGAAGLTDKRQLLDHLISFGINEKRLFSPNVNLNFYQEANPDLPAAGLDTGEELFDHLINFGAREGRQLAQPLIPEPVQPGPPDLPDFPELPGFPIPQSLNVNGGNLLLGGQSNSGQSAPDLNVVLANGLQSAVTQLQDFLVDPDFANKITTAFGEAANIDAAKSLIQELANAQSLPTIKMANLDELAGNQGAFDALTNTAYISQEFLLQHANNPENIASVLLEEIGHSIDSRINAVDAPGDEGSIFSQLVRGNNLSAEDLSKWKTEDDMTTLTLGNSNISVELSKQWSLWIYNRNNWKGWNSPVSSNVVNGNDNGINLNWGADSADKFSQVYLGDLKDNFIAVAGTTAYFEAGKTYKFRANADDQLFLLAVPYYNRNNGTRITSQWDKFDHSKGRPADKYYNFTPKETGWHTVYSYLYEEYGNAYMDVSWEPASAKLSAQADLNGEKRTIEIKSIDDQPITDKPTWLVIHGNVNNAGKMENVANAIRENDSNAQVLTLDWNSAANNVSWLGENWNQALDESTPWIKPVAQAARNLLTDFGISNKNLNLVGHSLGTYVSWEIAKSTPGGVKNIIALDPAAEVPGWYETKNIKFADYSDWSWAFEGSLLGDRSKAGTADEYFNMNFQGWHNLNPFSQFQKHGFVHEAFADLLKQNNSLWSLNRMNSLNKPWTIDYGPQPEATISFQKGSNNQWQVSEWRDSRGAQIAS